MELHLGTELGATGEPAAQRLTLYIPNKDRAGDFVVEHDQWVKRAHSLLTEIGAGATAFPPLDGTWLKPDGSTLWEQTRIIYCYIDPDKLAAKMQSLRQLLHGFGRETNQGQVVFEFDGWFWSIDQFDPAAENQT